MEHKKQLNEKRMLNLTAAYPITWGEALGKMNISGVILEPGDYITAGYNEGFYTENNSQDPHFFFYVDRLVEETDEEFQYRLKLEKERKIVNKRARRLQYEKLKEEFEIEDFVKGIVVEHQIKDCYLAIMPMDQELTYAIEVEIRGHTIAGVWATQYEKIKNARLTADMLESCFTELGITVYKTRAEWEKAQEVDL